MTIIQIAEKLNRSNDHLVDISSVGNYVCKDTFYNTGDIIDIPMDGDTVSEFRYCPICGKKLLTNN